MDDATQDTTQDRLPTFAELGLSEPLLDAVDDAGYEHPTPIQAEAIPLALAGATSSASRRPAPARPRRSRCPS